MYNSTTPHLARIQFSITASFHIIFPAVTLGLASFLTVVEGLRLRTGKESCCDLHHVWSTILVSVQDWPVIPRERHSMGR